MQAIRNRFSQVRVLVIGDLMLDEYLLGAANRISPEAPVPVVEIGEKHHVLGGAGNVAANIVSLGGQCSVAGTCGADNSAEKLRFLLEDGGIDSSGLVTIPGRTTTCKTRVIAGQQQIVRFDMEERTPLPDDIYRELYDNFEDQIPAADICVLSDYGKGVLSVDFCRTVIQLARKRNVPVLADPKGLRFEKYLGCTLITPNQREASRFTGLPVENEEDVIAAGNKLLCSLEGSAVLITRGPDGMTLFREGQPAMTVPTVARTIYDVVGAGDTALAALSISLGSGFDFSSSIHFANIAAGIAVGKQGTVAVTLSEVLEHAEITMLPEYQTDSTVIDNGAHLYSKT